MLLPVLLALLVLAAFAGGLWVVHWLFIIAAVLALVWLISFFAGGIGSRGARS